jgi:mobilization protein NikA
VDEKKPRMLSFEVSPEEFEFIEAATAKAGISRSEYLRARATSNPQAASNGNLAARLERLEALITHCIYMVNQVYVGLFSIAEAEGKGGRFLTAQQLDEVYEQTRKDALVYAVEFPESFAAVQTEIAALSKKGKA